MEGNALTYSRCDSHIQKHCLLIGCSDWHSLVHWHIHIGSGTLMSQLSGWRVDGRQYLRYGMKPPCCRLSRLVGGSCYNLMIALFVQTICLLVPLSIQGADIPNLLFVGPSADGQQFLLVTKRIYGRQLIDRDRQPPPSCCSICLALCACGRHMPWRYQAAQFHCRDSQTCTSRESLAWTVCGVNGPHSTILLQISLHHP